MMMKRRFICAIVSVVLILVCVFTAAAAARPAIVGGSSVNVLDFGAKGDGKADDTKAIQNALNYGSVKKRPVFLPAGTYRLTGSLVLKNVELVGQYSGSFAADNCSLPTLTVSDPDVPTLRLDNASVSGFRILCDYGTVKKAVFAAENIAIEGNNCHVNSVKTEYSGTGVRVKKEGVTGLEVSDFFMANPYTLGLDIYKTKGQTVLRNIEVWSATTRDQFLSAGVGIKLADNENMVLDATCVFAASIGYDISGSGKTVIDNGCADFSTLGIRAAGSADVTVNGGTYWAHNTALRTGSDAVTVRVTGTDMRGNGAPVLELSAAKKVEVRNSNLRRAEHGFNFEAVTIGEDVREAQLVGCNMLVRNGTGDGVRPVLTSTSKGSVTVSSCVLQSESPGRIYGTISSGTKLVNNVTGTYKENM